MIGIDPARNLLERVVGAGDEAGLLELREDRRDLFAAAFVEHGRAEASELIGIHDPVARADVAVRPEVQVERRRSG